MILVLSRLRRLNGSRFFPIMGIGVLIFLLPGCDLFKKAQKPPSRVSVPDRPRNQDRTPEKIDTVQWERQDRVIESNKPVSETKDIEIVKKDTYKVAVLVPLYTAQASKVYENENLKRMLHFYLGMQLAADKMNRGKPQINFHVFDIEAGSNRLDRLIRTDSLESYDFIIGPYKTADLKAVAELGKKKNLPIISPWNSNSSITERNPYYIQLKPGLKVHAEFISSYITQNFSNADVYLVASEKDERERSTFDYFSESTSFKQSENLKLTVKNLILPADTNIDFNKIIQRAVNGDRTKIFIVPYWSNWDFVNRLLNRILIDKKSDENIYVFGLPNMLESGEVEPELFDQLNIRLSYFNFVDLNQSDVVQFRQKFFDTYKELPYEDSFLGYDLVTWMSNAIKDEGSGFVSPRTKVYSQGLFNSIELVPEFGDRAISDDFQNYDYLENRSLKMIRLHEYRFEAIKWED